MQIFQFSQECMWCVCMMQPIGSIAQWVILLHYTGEHFVGPPTKLQDAVSYSGVSHSLPDPLALELVLALIEYFFRHHRCMDCCWDRRDTGLYGRFLVFHQFLSFEFHRLDDSPIFGWWQIWWQTPAFVSLQDLNANNLVAATTLGWHMLECMIF